MVKTLGMLFGIVFLAVGILGFVPGVTTTGPDGMPMLLGIFHVNTAHSIVHIASGAVFLIASMSGAGAARLWFQLFGIIYAIVAVLGFMNPSGPLLGMISNNPATTWLHVVLAAAMLLIGFATPKQTATA
jgi:uncharacterized protein DUF4383